MTKIRIAVLIGLAVALSLLPTLIAHAGGYPCSGVGC